MCVKATSIQASIPRRDTLARIYARNHTKHAMLMLVALTRRTKPFPSNPMQFTQKWFGHVIANITSMVSYYHEG